MSIFESIRNAIFGHASPAPSSASPQPPTSQTSTASGAAANNTAPPASAQTRASPSSTAPPPGASVDVGATLDSMARDSGQKLDWRSSIVDLMKLLQLDSSLEHRKALAAELGYTGNAADSAAMNTWLHRQVMAKLAASGGKVPEGLH